MRSSRVTTNVKGDGMEGELDRHLRRFAARDLRDQIVHLRWGHGVDTAAVDPNVEPQDLHNQLHADDKETA